MFHTLTGTVLLILAFSGYAVAIYDFLRIPKYFVPLAVVLLLSIASFCFGILNLMRLGVYCSVGVGLFLFLKTVLIHKRDHKKFSFNLIYLPAVLLLVYGLYFLSGGTFADGDTMTHWGVIVREMAGTNRLPNFLTTEVAYKTYPPLSACWIYFVTRCVGYSENASLLAQYLFTFSCVITIMQLWSRASENWGAILSLLCCLFLFTFSNIPIDDLKVDNLVTLLTVAGCSYIAFLNTKINGSKLKNSDLYILGGIVFSLPLIKSSGLFFSVFIIVLFFGMFVYEKRESSVVQLCFLALLPFLALLIWNGHTDLVFAKANESRHSFSIDYMLNVFAHRPKEEFLLITKNFISKWFSFNGSLEWISLLGLAISFSIYYVVKRKGVGVFLIIIIFYLFYKCSLWGMYCFNMPDSDAIILGAYKRYQLTYSLICIYFSLYFLLAITPQTRGKEIAIYCSSLVFSLLCLTLSNSHKNLIRPNYEADGVSRQLATIIKESKNQGLSIYRDSALVYTPKPYASFFVQFAFRNWKGEGTSDINKIIQALQTKDPKFDLVIVPSDKEGEVRKFVNGYKQFRAQNFLILRLK